MRYRKQRSDHPSPDQSRYAPPPPTLTDRARLWATLHRSILSGVLTVVGVAAAVPLLLVASPDSDRNPSMQDETSVSTPANEVAGVTVTSLPAPTTGAVAPTDETATSAPPAATPKIVAPKIAAATSPTAVEEPAPAVTEPPATEPPPTAPPETTVAPSPTTEPPVVTVPTTLVPEPPDTGKSGKGRKPR